MRSKEYWVEIPDSNGEYFVSNKYRVRSVKNGRKRILGITLQPHGYYKITMSIKGKRVDRSMHRVVATAFIPNPQNFSCVNHIDGNRGNYKIENLEWCSMSHNSRHAYITGSLSKSGEKNSMNKLTESNVLEIFKYVGRYADIAKKFGIVSNTVGDIKSGRRWGWLTGKKNPKAKERLIDNPNRARILPTDELRRISNQLLIALDMTEK